MKSICCRMLDTSAVVSEGQNKLVVKCVHCDSQILSPHSAKLLSEVHPLPTPTQPKEQTSPITEDVRPSLLFVQNLKILTSQILTGLPTSGLGSHVGSATMIDILRK